VTSPEDRRQPPVTGFRSPVAEQLLAAQSAGACAGNRRDDTFHDGVGRQAPEGLPFEVHHQPSCLWARAGILSGRDRPSTGGRLRSSPYQNTEYASETGAFGEAVAWGTQ
jgi:hypothetical protein